MDSGARRACLDVAGLAAITFLIRASVEDRLAELHRLTTCVLYYVTSESGQRSVRFAGYRSRIVTSGVMFVGKGQICFEKDLALTTDEARLWIERVSDWLGRGFE